MNIKELKSNIEICLCANLTPFVQGSPGLGKSAVVKQIAKEMDLELIDVRLSQCDISDLNGLPKLDGKKATFLPFDVFPIEGDSVPEGKKGWLLFLDELNSANKATQAASYKLILDRMVGNHKLHKDVHIVSAGNLITDNAVVNQLSTALRSRLINLSVDVDPNVWIEWGYNNEIDSRILAYIKYKPNNLFTFDPEKDDETYACPRTWEMCHRILKEIKNSNINNYRELLKGTIGSVANEFIEYTKYANKLPNITDIFTGKATIPSDLDLGMAWMIMFHLLANAKKITTDTECNNVLNYLMNMGKEYAAMFASQCHALDTKLYRFPAFISKLKDMCI